MAQLNAEAVAGDRPITRSSTDAALISTGDEQSGLWLWHGAAPPSPPVARPGSRVEHVLGRIMPAARWAGWMALSGGLALALLTVPVMHSAPPPRPEAPPKPPTALAPAPSTPVAHPVGAVPQTQPAEAQSDQPRIASVSAPEPAPQVMQREPERQMVQERAHRKPLRSVRKTQASRTRRGPLMMVPGVLTPPVMTWHGGGY